MQNGGSDDGASDARPHAIVIGSGFGGLAAAIRLGAKGYRVTICEKLDAPGGRAYVFRQDGFTFDAGPTIITAPYLFEELWALCGRRMSDDVDLRPIDPFYKIRFADGSVFTYYSDHERITREIARFEPRDVEAFDRYMEESREIYRVAFEELADQPFHTVAKLLEAFSGIIRLRGYGSVYAKVSRYFTNEKLRIVFSFHPLLIGGNPFRTTAYYCLISHLERKFGVHYAMGGMGSLVNGLVGLVKSQGSSVRLGAEVEEILVENGRAAGVRLAGGETLRANVVVSNADVAWTYGRLLSKQPRKRWTDAKLKRAKYSMGLFVWYFGTNRRYDDVYHHTIMMGPRYRELLDDIFDRKQLSPDFSLYLHRPTANDPALAPPGCDAFYALVPVPHLGAGIDWQKHAEPFRKIVEKHLESTMLPGLSQAIVTQKMLTPQDFRDRLLSVNGAGFSLEPTLFQSAWFRPHNLSEEVPGLYIVGAGTHPGAGLPGVVCSARVIDRLIPAVTGS